MRFFLDSLWNDRGHTWSDQFACPYKLCPSQWPDDNRLPPRMKFMEKIAPRVVKYRCLHCGCPSIKSADGPMVPEEEWAHNQNGAFLYHKPSFNFRRY